MNFFWSVASIPIKIIFFIILIPFFIAGLGILAAAIGASLAIIIPLSPILLVVWGIMRLAKK